MLLFTLRGHKGPIADIDVNYDNTLLITASNDPNVSVWKLENGEHLFMTKIHTQTMTVAKVSKRENKFFKKLVANKQFLACSSENSMQMNNEFSPNFF